MLWLNNGRSINANTKINSVQIINCYKFKINDMEIKKKHLKSIQVEVGKNGGFTVWIEEKVIVNGEKKKIKHWILDGSNIKEDGEIRLGSPDIYKLNAEYRKANNTIYVTKK